MGYKLSERTLATIPKLLAGVDSSAAWQAKREKIREVWKRLVGMPPSQDFWPEPGRHVAFEVMSERTEKDHRRLDIRYCTKDGDIITAYLLLPSGMEPGRQYPAVLAMHPTTDCGRADVATPQGRENRRYGLELVSRGYVVLAPDSISFGDRVYEGAEPFQTAPFYELNPQWTAVGKMLADHLLALNLLCSLPEVDPQRIGAIGHSLGGYNAWFLAGWDRRIRAVVSSCGFSMFTADPEPNRWGQREWFSHLPEVTHYLREDQIPFEWHEVAALAAPTPLFMWSGLKDRIFPNWQAIAEGMSDLEELYGQEAAAGSFEFWLGPAGHDFPPRARELAYSFLDRWLANNEK
ncbi:alpha/beta fold hydrolase [Paenibacillus sp. GD4]|uniref:alpha/beta hydrolase family protein n=1 Tax=Paenibacillus sp. GD4 TaxID=3068890 RepID=UPI002796753C|nr:alpha/beta fold hydrolase [Paenibacillus sp. GD4]MDQ1910677.1 alpha/beta fold hydrolase [Paenibacillus sp. GD4]